MFRNPRENATHPISTKQTPSLGRSPSPPRRSSSSLAGTMPRKATAKSKPTKSTSTSKAVQTTLVPNEWAKKSAAANAALKGKPRPKKNGNIVAFFQKAEELNNNLFFKDVTAKNTNGTKTVIDLEEENASWEELDTGTGGEDNDGARFNELGGSIKRRRISGDDTETPTPSLDANASAEEQQPTLTKVAAVRAARRGPFIDDSDSEVEELENERPVVRSAPQQPKVDSPASNQPADAQSPMAQTGTPDTATPTSHTKFDHPAQVYKPPNLLREATSQFGGEDFEEFEGLDDEDFPDGEEYTERKWMAEQRKLEKEEIGFEGDSEEFDAPDMFPEENVGHEAGPSCPVCNIALVGLSDQDILVHVNACLDGNPVAITTATPTKESTPPTSGNSKLFKKPPHPAKAGQPNPFQIGDPTTESKSAFSALMASKAEDNAWASAAASETASKGKPSYTRTCPFYKILPGFYICVDAFRYGAVKGQQAYFLSHFHSDHYVGLSATWSHGPIYCSKVTGNLVRQQLKVDPKWVVDLEFEEKTEVPGTEGVHVTMIPANHCPGSSLFLFEKETGNGKSARQQRVLHCGDFRACKAHIEHPLLRPEVLDTVSGNNREQKLDVCYLDTTYLNPKYSFPPQEQVIQACADMCVSLNKARPDEKDPWEQTKRDRAGQSMAKFVRKNSNTSSHDEAPGADSTKDRGRLLVVVGTYSIGKERICIGIAHALNSKIYAPPNKQRICQALEDAELNALLTIDPREAQVHMTPLFEIRGDTLEEYLAGYTDRFSRVVGFRPSGWNYRPPNTRVAQPSIHDVLYSPSWKSGFAMKDLVPQRGSTAKASCFGVPYSEHSSFRELSLFCCALRIERIIPTVNVGSAKSREGMKGWCEKWALERKKNGLFRLEEDGSGWS